MPVRFLGASVLVISRKVVRTFLVVSKLLILAFLLTSEVIVFIVCILFILLFLRLKFL